MAYENVTRRAVIKAVPAIGAAALTMHPLARVFADSPQIVPGMMTEWGPVVARYPFNPSVEDLDNKIVREALETDSPVRDSKYVPELLKLVQAARKQTTGFTVNEQIYYRFFRTSPIEIVLVEGMANNHDVGGFFDDSAIMGDLSVAYTDADFKPAIFIKHLCNALQYASHGAGDARSYGLTNRELAAMHVLVPELLKIPEEFDPLARFIENYRDSVVFENGMASYPGGIQYLGFLLYAYGRKRRSTQDPLTLDDVASKVVGVGYEFDNSLLSFSLEHASKSPRELDLVINIIQGLSISYIKKNAPNLSNDELDFLFAKIMDPEFRVVAEPYVETEPT